MFFRLNLLCKKDYNVRNICFVSGFNPYDANLSSLLWSDFIRHLHGNVRDRFNFFILSVTNYKHPLIISQAQQKHKSRVVINSRLSSHTSQRIFIIQWREEGYD